VDAIRSVRKPSTIRPTAMLKMPAVKLRRKKPQTAKMIAARKQITSKYFHINLKMLVIK
jgi:hypothetical protein